MKKITGILFLALFFAMQYGKLIGYWNCKITNSSDINAVQCDCEKILTVTGDNDDNNMRSESQTNQKIEEWFNPYASPVVRPKYAHMNDSFLSYISHHALAGVTARVFQPPKFS